MEDRTVVHFEIPARDVEKLKAFYEGLFGWRIERAPGPMDYWTIETVPVNEKSEPIRRGVNGGMYEKDREDQACVNYISVDDIDATLEKLVELGGSKLSERQEVPGVGYVATGRDPEGNPVAMLQPLI